MKDERFLRDKVPMTKEEVRASSIDKLQLKDAKTFLDVGAGSGSIAVQVAHDFPSIQVTAIEQKELAVELIKKNCAHFGVDNVVVLEGKAPLYDRELGNFDAIFIGGSGGNLTEIIDWSHTLLNDGGRLVLNFILLENALEALAYMENSQWQAVEASSLSVANWTKLGQGHYFKPQNSTIIISAQKLEK